MMMTQTVSVSDSTYVYVKQTGAHHCNLGFTVCINESDKVQETSVGKK